MDKICNIGDYVSYDGDRWEVVEWEVVDVNSLELRNVQYRIVCRTDERDTIWVHRNKVSPTNTAQTLFPGFK